MVSFTLEYTESMDNTVSKSTVDVDPSSTYWVTLGENSTFNSLAVFDLSDGTMVDSYNNSGVSQRVARWSRNTGNWIAFSVLDGSDNPTNVGIIDASDPTNISYVQTLSQASGQINDIAWSPDGSYIAYASSDDNTYIHDNDPTNDFPFVTNVQTSTATHDAVVFSNNSGWMVTNEGDRRCVYDTSDWSLVDDTVIDLSMVFTWEIQDNYLFNSNNGFTTGVVEKYETSTWTDTGDEWLNSDSALYSLHYHPSSGKNIIAVGAYPEILLVDASTNGSFLDASPLTDPTDNVNDVRWSDDGSWLATASSDNNIYVYSVTFAAFSGTVTDTNSNAVQGATVYAINDSDGTITGTDTTASDGTYSIDAPDSTTQHHLIVQYNDGSTDYHGLSQPYVTASE